MKVQCPKSLLSIIVFVLASIALTSLAVAEKRESMKTRLEREKTIRLQKLMRSERSEISGFLGSSLGDAYKRSYPVGINGAYHLSDQFAFGASAFYALSAETSLAEEIKKVRPARVGGENSFSSIDYGLGLDVIYTPIHGKFSLLGISALRYDLSATAGVHALGLSGAKSDGIKIAPSLGLNSHFFINQQLAFTVFYKGYLYWRADHAVVVNGNLSAEESAMIHGFGGVAISFFTGTPTIGAE